MLPMRDDSKQVKIELLSQWKLEAESHNSFFVRERLLICPNIFKKYGSQTS